MRRANSPAKASRAVRSFGSDSSAGFTLVEILVATALLLIILALTAQIVGYTFSTTALSNKHMDAASMARIVLDRFGNDFSSASLNGNATVLCYQGSAGPTIDAAKNSAIGFVSKSRARISSDSTLDNDVRGVTVGYKIRPLALQMPAGATVTVPVIGRGDAAFTFSQTNTNASGPNRADFSLWNIFGIAGRNLPGDLSQVPASPSATSDQNLLAWQGFGDGVLRFHVSFVLDDGRIVQSLQQGSSPNWTLNATYRNFQANGGAGDCLPVAFTAETSSDPNARHVTGLIVGIAVLDEATLRLAYLQDGSYAATLCTQLQRPVNDNETPARIWQSNLKNISLLPVRQNIRFYQRFYPVSL